MIFALDDRMHLKNLRTDSKTIIVECSTIKKRVKTVCEEILKIYNEQKRIINFEVDVDVEFNRNFKYKNIYFDRLT